MRLLDGRGPGLCPGDPEVVVEIVSFRDALIIEAAQAAGASELPSEDLQVGQRFGSLVLTNPFRKG
ncbi:hypothetical protein BH23GEM11_BH23GEM11_06690 [soil metagenome]